MTHRWLVAAIGAGAVALGLGLMIDARGVGTAGAVTASMDIASAGPLTHVYVGADLSCQIAHTGDADFELFPSSVFPGDCGTFVIAGGVLYGPDFASHGNTATDSLGSFTTFTPVSQSLVTGTGSAGDPFKVITIADAGATGLRITETDTYVVGAESYRTDVSIQNNSQTPQSAMIMRAGDCFLGSSDSGFGVLNAATKAVGCTKTANNVPPGRIEVWSPITPADHFFESDFDTVWAQIGSKTSLPDTCDCAISQDNGAAIEWDRTIPASGSVNVSHFTTFSPLGSQPLVASKTADASTAAAGAADGYTIKISNPNAADVTVTSVTDTLPAGFTYTSGSSTGLTTSDPSIASQTLTWSGSFLIPGGGNGTLHFMVTVASTAGMYFNNAGATASTDVVPTGDTAPITVGEGVTPTSTPQEGATNTPTATSTTTPTQEECVTPEATGTAHATRTAHTARTAQATSSPGTEEAVQPANLAHGTQTVHATQTVHGTQTVQGTRTAHATQTSEATPEECTTSTPTPTATATATATPTTSQAVSSSTPVATSSPGGGSQPTRSASPAPSGTAGVSVTAVTSPSPSPSVVSGVLGAVASPASGGAGGTSALPNAGQGPQQKSSPNYVLPMAFLIGGLALMAAGVYRPRRR